MKIDVKVITRASRPGVVLDASGQLRVKVGVVPEKGKANKEVIELVARYYGVGASKVSIVQGATSSRKTLLISGIGG